jgi:hypothetical protein
MTTIAHGADENHSVETPEPAKECVLCGRALAGLGVLIGLVFLYMSIDVLTDGKLTQLLGLGGNPDERAE